MIHKDQIYESCDPRVPTRIKVVGVDPPLIPGGHDIIEIVSIGPGGREVRRRSIDARQLHPSATTRSGEPRRRGYRLVQDAPGDER